MHICYNRKLFYKTHQQDIWEIIINMIRLDKIYQFRKASWPIQMSAYAASSVATYVIQRNKFLKYLPASQIVHHTLFWNFAFFLEVKMFYVIIFISISFWARRLQQLGIGIWAAFILAILLVIWDTWNLWLYLFVKTLFLFFANSNKFWSLEWLKTLAGKFIYPA